MTHRENMLRALRRQNPHHVPIAFSLCDSQRKVCREKMGTDDYMAVFDLPLRYVGLKPTQNAPDYSRYYSDLPEGTTIDEWGVGQQPSRFHHFTRMLHPMESFTTVEEVSGFPLPDFLEDYRWDGLAERIQQTKDAGYLAVYSAIRIFEPAWYLRGMEIQRYRSGWSGMHCQELDRWQCSHH